MRAMRGKRNVFTLQELPARHISPIHAVMASLRRIVIELHRQPRSTSTVGSLVAVADPPLGDWVDFAVVLVASALVFAVVLAASVAVSLVTYAAPVRAAVAIVASAADAAGPAVVFSLHRLFAEFVVGAPLPAAVGPFVVPVAA